MLVALLISLSSSPPTLSSRLLQLSSLPSESSNVKPRKGPNRVKLDKIIAVLSTSSAGDPSWTWCQKDWLPSFILSFCTVQEDARLYAPCPTKEGKNRLLCVQTKLLLDTVNQREKLATVSPVVVWPTQNNTPFFPQVSISRIVLTSRPPRNVLPLAAAGLCPLDGFIFVRSGSIRGGSVASDSIDSFSAAAIILAVDPV